MINNINFSRISNENNVSLVSRLLISPVNESLNGTVVTCEDAVSSLQSTTTTITHWTKAKISYMSLLTKT